MTLSFTSTSPPSIEGNITAGSGTVVLGPATLTNSIALGGAGSSGMLGLVQSDLDSISAEQLQIGYRNTDGTASLTGNINIASPITINTSQVPSLLLVTGGSVTQSTGATITALVPTSPPSLSLGVVAGGAVTLGEANQVATLAGFVDGAANRFLYRNDSAALSVGAVPLATIGVSFDPSTNIPTAQAITTPSGPLASALAGVTTVGGALTVATTGTATAGFDLALASPVSSGGGPITLMAGGSGGEFINGSVVDSTSGASAGNIAILADTMASRGGGFIGLGSPGAITAGTSGTVVLGPVTTTDLVALGGII